MAVTGTPPSLTFITAGLDLLTRAFIPGQGYVTNTGTLQPVVRQIKRGTGPWKNVRAVELSVAGETVRFREIGFNASFVGNVFVTNAVTPFLAGWVIESGVIISSPPKPAAPVVFEGAITG